MTITANLRLGAWLAVGLAIALAAMSLQFRFGLGELQDFTIDANGPRWLLAFAAGALFGCAGLQVPARYAAPEWFLAISTASAAGCVLGWQFAAAPGAWFGLAAGAVLGHLAVRMLPPHRVVAALLCLALAAAGLFAGSLVKAEPNTARLLVWWALGDVGHATWATGVIGVLALPAVWLIRDARASGWLALGLAVGLAGPIAFLAWWIPLAEARIAGLAGARRIFLCMIAGGVLLLTVDAVQRFLIGGYGFGLNFPLALIGTPIYLWWCAGRRASARRFWRGVAVLIAVAAVLFSRTVAGIIQSAT
jgi:hypothetical protein